MRFRERLASGPSLDRLYAGQLPGFLIAVSVLLATPAAWADTNSYGAGMRRVDPSKLTCAQVQAQLASGPVILHWLSASGKPRWGKYVPADGLCPMQGIKVRASVKASDGPCRVHQCNQYGPSPQR